MNDRLKITSVESKVNTPASNRTARRQEMQATMERLWHKNPQQFDPKRDCIQRLRVYRTLDAINQRMAIKDKRLVDLGCGAGFISLLLRDKGAKVDAVDVATNALALLKEKDLRDIKPIHDCLPNTRLEDNAYDLVVCTEVIGYLDSREYRIFFAELSRLVKTQGIVVCSTDLDIDTDEPLERLALIAETELNIDQWILSYHRLFIKLCRFLEAPSLFVKMCADNELRAKQLTKRSTLGKWWYKLNCTPPFALLWSCISRLTTPMLNHLKQSPNILEKCEKICKLLWNQNGVSHAIFVGRHRPLSYPLPANEIPREMKHKRQVWE